MLFRFLAVVPIVFGKIVRPMVFVPVAAILLTAGVVHLVLTTEAAPNRGQEMTALQGKARPAAPDFVGGADWLNTDKPIKLEDLRGRIVLLDFWTLCCINCIHTLPDLAKLEAQVSRRPGRHRHSHAQVRQREENRKHPQGRSCATRSSTPSSTTPTAKSGDAYGVESWPTLVLIDPDGKYYGSPPGKGNYKSLDQHIDKLIKEYQGQEDPQEDAARLRAAQERAISPLYFPGKVLADAESKRLFIADSTNHRIVITDLEGKKIAVAGSGKEGFKDGAFAEATFSDPQGMALDGETLYVADRKNHCIRALDLKKRNGQDSSPAPASRAA